MAQSFKGSIAFGLVYIPIALHSAVKADDVSFNFLHKETGQRVKYIKTVEGVGEVVKADIVKGYMYEKGKYVVFDDKDFESIKTPKDKSITIEQFVNLSEIDPVYFDKAYYVVPSGAEKAYSLLLTAMEIEDKVGIAKTVIGTRESVVALRALNGKMILNTLHFHAEITANIAPKADKVDAKELDLAKMLIDGMTKEFNAQDYEDTYKLRLLEAVDAKIKGKEITHPKATQEHKMVSLMEALQKSVIDAAKAKVNKRASSGQPKSKTPPKKKSSV